MNKYIDINRVEFLITNNCTSKCIHCSNYNSNQSNHYISKEVGKKILNAVSNKYSINSVMTFGGEPLLYPDSTIEILEYAKELGIASRQIITNAFWSRKKSKIDEICIALEKADVNSILISVDCFHNEYLDSEIVNYTISKLMKTKLKGLLLHPCWYESEHGNNKYDKKTREIINAYSLSYNIEISSGNVLFPAGRAIDNFPERFKPLKNIRDINCDILPYTDNPNNIKSICINPDGLIDSLCSGNKMEIYDFLENYDPYTETAMNIFLEEGFEEVISYAKELSIRFDISKYYSVCEACKELRGEINRALRTDQT